MKHTPPKYLLRFFRWFCHPDYVEDIEGDLLERFEKRVKRNGVWKAKFILFAEVLGLLRITLLRPLEGFHIMNNYGLFRNNIKTTYRFLSNYKAFTLINLSGLSVGVLIAFYAFEYVWFEGSYDSYHEHKDEIYRLVTDIHTPTGLKKESTSVPMGPAIENLFPRVKSTVRVVLDYAMLQSDPGTYMREDYAYVDKSIFSVFSFPLIAGNPDVALNDPYAVVLSKSAAIRYFGTTDCLGKQLLLDGMTKMHVTAIMKDIPENSHFKVDVFFSMKLLTHEWWDEYKRNNWRRFGCYTYLQLEKGTSPASLNKKLTKMVNDRIADHTDEFETVLEPLGDLYLFAESRGYRTGASRVGNIQNLYVVGIVGLLVIFVAGFNFVNLSSALSHNRTREVGVRKVLGANKAQLRLQFLLDATGISVASFFVSVSLLFLTYALLNELTGKEIFLTHPYFSHILTLLILSIGVGVLSGIYPALRLSNLGFEHGLQGHFSSSVKGQSVSKILLVSQFVVSVFLLAFTLGIYQQLIYLQNASLGYDRNHKLVLDFFFDTNIKTNENFVRQEMLTIPEVSQVSFSSCVPGLPDKRFETKIPSHNGDLVSFTADVNWIDPEFLDQYKMVLVAGRAFSKEIRSDIDRAMIINEKAVSALGYSNPRELIGKPFKQGNHWNGTVIGVVEDFHHFSLREEILPMTFRYDPGRHTYATVTLSGKDVFRTIDQLKEKWVQLKAKRPFDYHFLDQSYQMQYDSETRFGKLIMYFAFITIFISNLGLLGMSAFRVKQRTKEIGIRKVLGADVVSVLKLVVTQFLKLIFIGSVIGILFSYFGLSHWLENFAYRITPDWWLFTLSVGLTLAISLLTITSQVIKVARTNPVDSLRDE